MNTYVNFFLCFILNNFVKNSNYFHTHIRRHTFCPGLGPKGSRLRKHPETPRRPSPQTTPPAPPGEAQGVPRPAERHSPSSVSWGVPWASSRWDVPGTPPEEGIQEAFNTDA
ncbi:hypothetical protein ATANTOWER_015794 [Ataeniobius toweri]|uniref:Uncharacterized protein n=1 Tax=Ataeniobius toweri TaxID=208326 RepID=A0ABU7C806_9TELE|nr:hypothetical protein [Ataeniobius toweri]